MRTSSAKAKGRRLQDWVRDRLLAYLQTCCDPEDLEDTVTTAIMGESGADVKLVGRARKYFPYSIECKNQEKFSGIYNIIDQARNHSSSPPLAFIKMNRRKPLVILEAEEFFTSYFKHKEEDIDKQEV
jgi:hypothetical protein|tara:strand:- start:612 stop:995 length:384 start_codon:yes stop_codon:yes gene_type:complete